MSQRFAFCKLSIAVCWPVLNALCSHRVSIFVSHASQVGFFLNLARFLDIIYLPDVTVRRRVLSCALLDVVLLWGAHLSSNDTIKAHESTFLTRAVKSVLEALPLISSRQHNAVHVIQAEVLLANYFFCQARSLEGTYHCSAAVALALSCRLNLQRGSPQIGGSPSGFILAPASDAIEEMERTNAFWAAFILDRTWTVASGPLPNDVFSGLQISAPWPADNAGHEQVGVSFLSRPFVHFTTHLDYHLIRILDRELPCRVQIMTPSKVS